MALARAMAAKARLETFEVSADEQERLALAALPLLEAAGDHAGLADVWDVARLRRRTTYAAATTRWSTQRSRRSGTQAWRASSRDHLDHARHLLSCTAAAPAVEALRRLDALAERYPHPAIRLVSGDSPRDDRPGRRRAVTRRQHRKAPPRARRFSFRDGNLCGDRTLVGNHEAAAERLRPPANDSGSSAAADGTALHLRRLALAATSARSAATTKPSDSARQGRELGDENDPITQSLWRQVQALVAAHRGEPAEAERLAREAVDARPDRPTPPGTRPTRSTTSPRCSKPPVDTTKPPSPTGKHSLSTSRSRSSRSPAAPANDSPRSKRRRPETQADAAPRLGVPCV